MNDENTLPRYSPCIVEGGVASMMSNPNGSYVLLGDVRRATPPSPSTAPIKDHVLREVVNSLRNVALKFHDHGSLRERLRAELEPLLAASEGAAPIAEGEREAFERWMINEAKIIVGSSDPYPAGLERDYWRVWQAATRVAIASRPAAREAARQSIANDPRFTELLDEFAYRASERRAMGGEFGSADNEEVAETALIARIDTWGGAALAASTATQKEE